MFAIRVIDTPGDDAVRVIPVGPDGPLVPDDEAALFCRTADVAPGTVEKLRSAARTVLVAGVGADDAAADWRAAGAAAVRAAGDDETIQFLLPAGLAAPACEALAEGIWFGGYHAATPRTAEVLLAGADPDAVGRARTLAEAVWFARDLTNMPSSVKNPPWFAEQVVAAAAQRPDLSVTVRDERQLAAEGFGAILAVGGGSATPPRLVEMSYRPAGATRHVVLVGKGITFDTGGISIKTRDGMKLMKKDMAGAAAVVAATLAAADLALPVRITTLVPLAENAVSGSAYRPGDVITHYDGTTSETTNSDAEGRLVLADALGYAVTRLDPDVVVDLATLTGAASVALGKGMAALYSHDDDLAGALTAAGAAAGERMWRLPLPEDYVEYLHSDVADRHSSPTQGVGSVVAALYLREFLGDKASVWAHLDMSAPAWSERVDGELAKGATGWGVRTLVRWLAGA